MIGRSWTGVRVEAINARPATELAVIRSFGMHVKSAREAKGWTQTELAARAGVSAPHVSRVEAGVQSSSLEKAVLIAAALGESLDELARAEER